LSERRTEEQDGPKFEEEWQGHGVKGTNDCLSLSTIGTDKIGKFGDGISSGVHRDACNAGCLSGESINPSVPLGAPWANLHALSSLSLLRFAQLGLQGLDLGGPWNANCSGLRFMLSQGT